MVFFVSVNFFSGMDLPLLRVLDIIVHMLCDIGISHMLLCSRVRRTSHIKEQQISMSHRKVAYLFFVCFLIYLHDIE